jgi:hypothetical protein
VTVCAPTESASKGKTVVQSIFATIDFMNISFLK